MKRFAIFIVMLFLAAALQAGPNIVLVTIDSLRADHLHCYGYSVNTSPNIDQLASQGLLYQYAFSAVPLTLPSHATILSGVYPLKHGIHDNAHFPPPSQQFLQELLKPHNYTTAAFISGEPLHATFGLNRGFDYYNDDFSGAYRKANATTDLALDWLKTAKSPYLLWVHYYDLSAGYTAQTYDGEIASIDQELGRLLKAISTDSAIVLTAAHGESLGEHGESTHGVFLYNATLHIPLIVRAPQVKPAIRKDLVSLGDITPTILEIAGVQPIASDGVSLLNKKRNRTLLAESLYAQRNFGYAPLFAGIHGTEKFIESPQAEFYNFKKDPAEKNNLGVSPDWRSEIQAYAKSSPNEMPSAASSIDPKTKAQQIEMFNQALSLFRAGKYSEAETAFHDVTIAERWNCLARKLLGDVYAAQSQYTRAAVSYQNAYNCRPDPDFALQIAKAYIKDRKTSDATALLQDTVQKFPTYAEARFELASIYEQDQKWNEAMALLNLDLPAYHNQRGLFYFAQKNTGEAKSEFQRAVAAQPHADYFNNLGTSLKQLAQIDEAERAYQNALTMNPDHADAKANLAFLLMDEQKWDEAQGLLARISADDPRYWNAQFSLGIALQNLKKPKEAVTVFKNLLANAPADWPMREETQQRLRHAEVEELSIEEIPKN